MSTHRQKILEMLAEGRISVDEARALLEKLDAGGEVRSDPSEGAVEDVDAGVVEEGADRARGGEKVEDEPSVGKPKVPLSGLEQLIKDAERMVAEATAFAGATTAGIAGQVEKMGKDESAGEEEEDGILGALSVSLQNIGNMSVVVDGGIGRVKKTRTFHIDHEAGKSIRVRTVNGFIKVVKYAGEQTSVAAHILAKSRSRLERIAVKLERQSDGVLTVDVCWPDGKNRDGEGCNLEIMIPDAVGVEATTSNGEIEVKEMAGTAVLATSNSPIRLQDHDGEARLSTSNGPVELKNVRGHVEVMTSNGRIRAVEMGGMVDARTCNGPVDVELGPTSEGPIQLYSSNARIRATLNERFSGRVAAETSNGRIAVDKSDAVRILMSLPSAIELEVGKGGATSVLSTSNGSIHIHLRGR